MADALPETRAVPVQRPTLRTERLTLRPATLDDSAAVVALANDMRIAQWLLRMPHPYAESDARVWISTHQAGFERGEDIVLFITERDPTAPGESGRLMGAIGLQVNTTHRRAELGYWLGLEFWGRGFASEAGRAIIDYGFARGDIDRIHAEHFDGNEASGRVLAKLGMTHEGVLRGHSLRFGRRRDGVAYGILRTQWLERTAHAQ